MVGLPDGHPVLGLGLAHEKGMLGGWDVLVLKLLMHQQIHDLLPATPGLRVVDIDDLHVGLPESNLAHQTTDPLRDAHQNRAVYERIIRAVDRVTVSTEFLADFYGTRVRDVRLVRNTVRSGMFSPIVHDERVVIGWVGGTLWRSGDIEILRPWLARFARQHDVQVYHGGHIPNDPHPFSVRANVPNVQTRTLRPIEKYAELFEPVRIGLVPLSRHPFSEAKSFLKGLEYAAMGIPFIASPSREYRYLHAHGVGRLASSPDEWWDHAAELLDPDVRRAEAQRQRRIVLDQFDITRRGHEWVSALSG